MFLLIGSEYFQRGLWGVEAGKEAKELWGKERNDSSIEPKNGKAVIYVT